MSDNQEVEQGDIGPGAGQEAEYQVLARKYRPEDFTDLIGQDAMVRTLTNAFESGRIAHAFILTGVRGVGKTTTARVIARALNCVGPDGDGDPTIEPCGQCEFCHAIAEDRLIDVLEIDAASSTRVDDIRELIEGVRYKPVSARYKVYIIDEVHMLSRNAFNALLKTLEEPPAHVKFIFATTEIRKIPVTVLSRCQRFDLKRVEVEALVNFFTDIAGKEGAEFSDAAISLIARAADGSVRDGLSLLDQAVTTGAGGGELGEDAVREMLGLADRERSFSLLERILKGDVAEALNILSEDYANGADPILLVQDLLEAVHWITRVKVTPDVADGPTIAEADKVWGKNLTGRLSMASLTRAWQMLLKGLREAQLAPSPIKAVEMIVIRLAYLTDLPTPADAVKSITDSGMETSGDGGYNPSVGAPVPTGASPSTHAWAVEQAMPSAELAPVQSTDPVALVKPDLQSFKDVITLTNKLNERILKANLVSNVHLVGFEPATPTSPGNILYRPGKNAPGDLAQQLSRFLNDNTGQRWVVAVSLNEQGVETVLEREEGARLQKRRKISEHPFMQSVLETFPGAEIEEIREIGGFDETGVPEKPEQTNGEFEE